MGGPRTTTWQWLGRVEYPAAEELQREARAELLAGRGPERLLLLEHPPVFTLGRNAADGDVVADPAWLARREVSVHWCDRGGQATYHGPGQLVGYPVIDLSPDRRDVRRYVRDLQEVLVRAVAELGVRAEPRPMPEIGLWVEDGKLASFGIHLSRWVTTHGFALNVQPDLGHFAGIVPCGLDGVRMVSVASLTGRRHPLPEVAQRVARRFGEVFGRTMVAAETTVPAVGVAGG